MLAPILLFTYNRLDHTRKTVETLLKNQLASQSELYVFSDQSKKKNSQNEVEEVRKYLNQITGFKSISRVYHDKNKGLANSIIQGVSQVFKQYDKVIVLEDDLETSPYFLNFMNQTLDYYSPDKVWSIAGYSPDIKISNDYKFDSYLVHRNCSWGWATWKQNWEKTDWEVKDFKTFFLDKNKRKTFERGGNDLSIMLLKQQQRMINSWSIRFNYSAYKNNLPSVYPTISFIKNIGVDGSGTNMKKSLKYSSILNLDIKGNYNYCNSSFFEPKIEKAFKNFYNTSLYRKTINWFKAQSVMLSLKK